MEILAILLIICVVSKCVIIKKRDSHWWQGLIPLYNTYKIGKLCGAKKLGIANAISQCVLSVFFFLCFGFEIYLIQKYSMNVDLTTYTEAYVVVPENVANIAIASKYILIAIAAITFSLWCVMMWKFTKVHKKSSWWILIWAIIPAVAFAAFAISNDVYINGNLYTSKRILSEKGVKK